MTNWVKDHLYHTYTPISYINTDPKAKIIRIRPHFEFLGIQPKDLEVAEEYLNYFPAEIKRALYSVEHQDSYYKNKFYIEFRISSELKQELNQTYPFSLFYSPIFYKYVLAVTNCMDPIDTEIIQEYFNHHKRLDLNILKDDFLLSVQETSHMILVNPKTAFLNLYWQDTKKPEVGYTLAQHYESCAELARDSQQYEAADDFSNQALALYHTIAEITAPCVNSIFRKTNARIAYLMEQQLNAAQVLGVDLSNNESHIVVKYNLPEEEIKSLKQQKLQNYIHAGEYVEKETVAQLAYELSGGNDMRPLVKNVSATPESILNYLEELRLLREQVSALKKENSNLKVNLQSANTKIASLEKELNEANGLLPIEKPKLRFL